MDFGGSGGRKPAGGAWQAREGSRGQVLRENCSGIVAPEEAHFRDELNWTLVSCRDESTTGLQTKGNFVTGDFTSGPDGDCRMHLHAPQPSDHVSTQWRASRRRRRRTSGTS